jgi:hypothetical protein
VKEMLECALASRADGQITEFMAINVTIVKLVCGERAG